MPSGQKSLEFVTVGDPGNAADTAVMTSDGTSGYGAIACTYQIGKYDVTAAQYCQFLNAVAGSDPYGLYNVHMGNIATNPGPAGCGIARSVTAGKYTYAVTPGRENMPVNWVSWGDAVRFCNWVHNGQPMGPAGPGTTETGAYPLDGATDWQDLARASRDPAATCVLPTEDEWYKAAYYKGGSASAGYWLYATGSNTEPSNVLSSTGTNNANFWNVTYTDPVNLLTPVGAFAGSPGPYGTYDQCGNLAQWNETLVHGVARGLRGGACIPWSPDCYHPYALDRRGNLPTDELLNIGFRVAMVPEPGTPALLALAGLLVRRRR